MTQTKTGSVAATIVKTFQIEAPMERVYKAFTDKKDLEEWMMDPFEVDAHKGGKFKMGRETDGYATTGEFLELVPNQLLVYTWRMNEYDKNTRKRIPNWSDDKPSKVTVKFEKAGKGTKVTVVHENFPERNEEYWAHEVGWELLTGEILKYYLEHSQEEFDRWWSQQEATWEERWQKIVEERTKAASK